MWNKVSSEVILVLDKNFNYLLLAELSSSRLCESFQSTVSVVWFPGVGAPPPVCQEDRALPPTEVAPFGRSKHLQLAPPPGAPSTKLAFHPVSGMQYCKVLQKDKDY